MHVLGKAESTLFILGLFLLPFIHIYIGEVYRDCPVFSAFVRILMSETS